MAKNGNGKKKDKARENSPKLKTETKHGIKAVVFFVFALFFLMSAFNVAGVAGRFVYDKLHYLLGFGYIMLPALFVLLGTSFLKREGPNIGWTRTVSGIMFLLSSLGMIDVTLGEFAGGLLGRFLSVPFVYLFDIYASLAFLGAILIIAILAMFDAKLNLLPFLQKIKAFFVRKPKEPNFTPMPLPENAEAEDEEDDEEHEEETESAGEKIKKALGMKTEAEEEI